MVNATLAGFVYIVVAENGFSVSILHDYIRDICNRFEHAYGPEDGQAGGPLTEPLVSKGRGYGEFDDTLKRQLKEAVHSSKKTKVDDQLEATKGMLIDTIDQVLQRHTSIEVIVRETESLSHASSTFKDGTKVLRRTMWWRNARCNIFIGVTVVLVIFIILMVACKPDFSKCGNS